MPTDPLIAQHAVAARLTTGLAQQATPEQLTLPTPCAGWDLRRLLDHMTSENLGFAAAARGQGADLSVWAHDENRADPVADYVAATDTLLAAFAEPGVLDQSFALPLLTTEREFPGHQAVLMQLVDGVVHAWDLARTLGLPLSIDDELTKPVLELARPDPRRRSPPSPRRRLRPRPSRSRPTRHPWTRSSPCSAARPLAD